MYLSITTLHHCWHGLILFSSAVHARTRITSSQPLESWQPVPATAPACPGSTRKVDCSWPWPSSLLTSRPSAWSGNCLQVISFSSCLFVYCQKFAQKSRGGGFYWLSKLTTSLVCVAACLQTGMKPKKSRLVSRIAETNELRDCGASSLMVHLLQWPLCLTPAHWII